MTNFRKKALVTAIGLCAIHLDDEDERAEVVAELADAAREEEAPPTITVEPRNPPPTDRYSAFRAEVEAALGIIPSDEASLLRRLKERLALSAAPQPSPVPPAMPGIHDWLDWQFAERVLSKLNQSAGVSIASPLTRENVLKALDGVLDNNMRLQELLRLLGMYQSTREYSNEGIQNIGDHFYKLLDASHKRLKETVPYPCNGDDAALLGRLQSALRGMPHIVRNRTEG